MLKYMLAIFAVAGVTLVGAFLLLAWLNDDGAAAGPAPLITLTVDDIDVTPARLEIDHDRLFELKLVNNASLTRHVLAGAANVEQLPVETELMDTHGQVVPIPGITLSAPSGSSSSVLLRFTERGTFELHVETPGRPDTRRTVTVEVS